MKGECMGEVLQRQYQIMHIRGMLIFSLILICLTLPVHVRAEEQDEDIILGSRQEFYREVSKQILEHERSRIYVTDVGTLGNDMQAVLDGYYYYYDAEHPLESGSYLGYYLKGFNLNWIEGGRYAGRHNCQIEVELEFKYAKEKLDQYFAHMHTIAMKLKKKSDYKSVKAAHDYVIRKYDYDDQLVSRIDYDGYRTGKMVCLGYCMAMYYLLSDMGIPSRIVLGTSDDVIKDTDHAWNVVKVDGKWYNLDATWDDKGALSPPVYTYFLKNDSDFYKHTREGYYDYDDDMAMTSYPMPDYRYIKFLVLIGIVTGIAGARFFYMKRKQKQDRMKQIVIVEDDITI